MWISLSAVSPTKLRSERRNSATAAFSSANRIPLFYRTGSAIGPMKLNAMLKPLTTRP